MKIGDKVKRNGRTGTVFHVDKSTGKCHVAWYMTDVELDVNVADLTIC